MEGILKIKIDINYYLIKELKIGKDSDAATEHKLHKDNFNKIIDKFTETLETETLMLFLINLTNRLILVTIFLYFPVFQKFINVI